MELIQNEKDETPPSSVEGEEEEEGVGDDLDATSDEDKVEEPPIKLKKQRRQTIPKSSRLASGAARHGFGTSSGSTASGSSKKSGKQEQTLDASALAQLRVQAQFAMRRKARREERRSKAMLGQRFDGIDIEAFRLATRARLVQKASGTDVTETGPRSVLFPLRTKASTSDAISENAEESTVPSIPSSLAPSEIVSQNRKRRRRIAVVGGGPVGLWIATLIALRSARRVRPQAAGAGAAAAKAALCNFIRGPDAPEIIVFERRGSQEHCSRRNVRITLSEHTVSLLNKHTKSHRFVSGMALAEIETILLEQWRRLGGSKCLEYDRHIENPIELAKEEDWDLVLWAGGRNSLDDETRASLGCETKLGDNEEVLIFEMRDFSMPRRDAGPVRIQDLEQLAAADLTFCARQGAAGVTASPSSTSEDASNSSANSDYRIVLRCGNDAETPKDAPAPFPLGWLWLMGLPSELKAAKDAVGPPGQAHNKQRHPSMKAALDAELKRLGLLPDSGPDCDATKADASLPPLWVQRIQAAVAAVQDRVLSPASVSVRWVDASFWSSDRVVCPLPAGPSGRCAPLVVVGDAAMGKPFYSGTTLNVHLAEVKALSKLPVVRWGQNNSANPSKDPASSTAPAERRSSNRYLMSTDRASVAPFLSYEERYKHLLARTPGFRRNRQ
eukprot:TRINITY_DN3487_c1_g5_i1.p1 TRINITY_DN3487_c1_g5~~TRINITY_DN3487_c1_g5_i1.p1  ORF type:complete len:671 (-),score=127.47 TRINITY_DN3487_c1_g5_i1:456-2468(-)